LRASLARLPPMPDSDFVLKVLLEGLPGGDIF
jgi:hypothetical protein